MCGSELLVHSLKVPCYTASPSSCALNDFLIMSLVFGKIFLVLYCAQWGKFVAAEAPQR
jgi:hypothetical protein